MAEYDDVRIAFQRADRIGQALALRHRRIFHFVDWDDRTTEPLPRRGEGRRGTGLWLIEQVRQNLAFQQIKGPDALDHAAHLVRHTEDVLEVAAPELFDRNDVLAIPVSNFVFAKRQVGGRGICWHFYSLVINDSKLVAIIDLRGGDGYRA